MSEERGGGSISGGLPAAPQRIPGLPANASPHELHEFRTLNRQVSRASIGDQDMAWCQNLVPIAPNYLRATPDSGDAIYASSIIILYFDFWVDSDDVGYAINFRQDGSAEQARISDGAITTVAVPGTFSTDAVRTPAMVQAGLNKKNVVLIASPQLGQAVSVDNGYFIWDGTNLYQAGTTSPVTTITDGGQNYTSVPNVVTFGGSGAGAVLVAEIDGGSVSLVRSVVPGSGYLETDSAILVFSGGGQGTTAYGLGVTADGVITSLTLVYGGAGFTSVPTITITPVGAGSGATAVVTSISGGIITGVQMLTGGSGYSSGATVTVSGGTTAPILEPVIEDGVVVSVTIINSGPGYLSPPDVHYICTSGSGAGGVVEVLNGFVQGVRFDFPSQGGSGYQTPPIVQFTGGGGPAAGTISLMPFGVKGTSIETYASRVWIADGNRLFYSAPESLVEFAALGGSVAQDTDPFQRFEYRCLKQSNGFLYLISDSSVNYISGVTTAAVSSTNATLVTTFTNLNIDPQIGAAWRNSVTVFSRSIIFANENGVFSITGGAVQKISDALDRMFYDPSLDFSVLSGFLPSSAVGTIFAKDMLAFMAGMFNPVTQVHEPTLCMWNGKQWSTATQSRNPKLINSFETDSNTTIFGTDGFLLFPLFAAPSTALPRVLQSKLWLRPSILVQKRAWGIYALFECYDNTMLDFQVDTETGAFTVTQGAFPGAGSVAVPGIAWARSSASAPAGIVIGFTMTSQSADFALLTALLVAQDLALET